ncbi:hypothetical protein [Rhodopirellula europaea]|uniref:Putative secreted protein n=1 Tax=Rhodopirellula europaea 6C TaxID=1263867 RepID=M2AND5_9BACT|nr:hypothetical protein [Rhodopirellula europaea]EMB18635.1 putative secreted protein [Rhodopirellula europaea 6C]
MKIRFASPLLLFALAIGFLTATQTNTATAQSAVLAEIYGRGVHAYNAGNYSQAYELLSMAIDNNIRDPRAYYFRGLAANASGMGYAEGDWQTGAELEARGGDSRSIGRALSRIQGSQRLKLELIREKARLQALATGAARSQIRSNELSAQGQPAAQGQPSAPSRAPAMQRGATPPPAPASDDNPFADDLAAEDAVVESNDAFEGAMDNPLATEAAPADASAAPADGGASPFDAGDTPADPFAPAGDSDPFAPAGDDDPFSGF